MLVPLLLESLYKYNLMEEFKSVVAGFANGIHVVGKYGDREKVSQDYYLYKPPNQTCPLSCGFMSDIPVFQTYVSKCEILSHSHGRKKRYAKLT